jgi:hypothetical protein
MMAVIEEVTISFAELAFDPKSPLSLFPPA